MAPTSSIQFRPIGPEDQDFLYRVYASTRADVAATLLDEEEKSEFLRMQFGAQHQYYQTTFPRAEFLVILFAGTPVGRLYVDRPGDEIHLIDIALLPEYRRRGLGTALMATTFAEAGKADLPVRIYVEHYNDAAIAWYQRLGFVTVEDIQTHLRMEWTSSATSSSTDTNVW